MGMQSTNRLGALEGKWNVPSPDTLKVLLQPEPDVESSFYESNLDLSTRSITTREYRATQRERLANAEFEIYRDVEGGLRWRLRTEGGQVLAESGESYPSRASCREAIRLVRSLGPGASVNEQA